MLKTPFTSDDFEIVKREILYKGFFRLLRFTLRHRLFGGGWSETFTREILDRRHAVMVLPYDPHLDRVILIEQFRVGSLDDPLNPWQIEVPAGILDKDETPENVAIRESYEEAHCEILALYPVCDYYASPGGSNEYIHLYCGKIDSRGIHGIHGLKQENEDIRVINISTSDAFQLLHQNQIKNAPAIVLLFWLQAHRLKLQDIWK